MRLLQVMAGAEQGGAETAFVDMVLALHEKGVTQHVATRANPLRVERLRAGGVTVTELPFGGKLDLYTPFRLRRLIRTFEPDIVQTWMSRAAQKTPAWNGRGKRYLKICRLGGYYKLKHFPGADEFTTITPDIKDYLIRQGVPAERITHINNFAEVGQPQSPMNRANHATPADAPLIVTLGRLHHAKAFDTLLRALAQIPGVHLWIGGEGPDRAALERLAESLNLSDRVHFLGWITDRAALLQAGDICVFPSRYEPFGTVFVQAWSQGIPLITSNAAGPRQYVRDGEDALVFEIDDIPALTACIRRLLADPALAACLAQNGKARYQNEFTKDRTVSAYLEFYESALNAHKKEVKKIERTAS